MELTRKPGFLTILEDKPGVSIMADKGFTIKQQLHVRIFWCMSNNVPVFFKIIIIISTYEQINQIHAVGKQSQDLSSCHKIQLSWKEFLLPVVSILCTEMFFEV